MRAVELRGRTLSARISGRRAGVCAFLRGDPGAHLLAARSEMASEEPRQCGMDGASGESVPSARCRQLYGKTRVFVMGVGGDEGAAVAPR